MKKEVLKLTNFKLSISDRILIDNSSQEDENLLINSGDVVLVCGSNGTGKTALFKKIIGSSDVKQRNRIKLDNAKLSIAYEGVNLTFEEKMFNGESFEKGILDEIGFSPNDSDMKLILDESLTMKEFLNDVLKGKFKENEAEIMRLFKVFYGEKATKYIKAKIGKCSSGEQKKLSIISALIRKNKSLYLFDEPMNCLDTKSMIDFMNELNQLKDNQPESAFVIITHCLLFDNPSKVYKIVNSKLINDTPNYVKRDCLDYLLK